jgi:hypothetical protein
MPSGPLICDGCGQTAGQEHIARRLRRLENMTRYRPIHVQALFLGAVSPAADEDHLYSAEGEFRGEGLALLRGLGIDPVGKIESVLTEFQRRGFLFTHILECPIEPDSVMAPLLEGRFAATAARIRRSLKPRKLVFFGAEVDPFVERLANALPGIEMVLSEQGKGFRLNELAVGALAAG